MNEAATYYGEHEAEDAMAVMARWMGRNNRIQVIYHNGTAVDADIYYGVIRIPRLACASGITQEALMLLRGRVYHEAGHIDETKLSKADYPKGALHEIWNALEDRRMETVESSRHKGCEVVFRWGNHYYNRKIAAAISGGKDAPLWEALVAMSLLVEGIQPAWHLTPKAQDYLDVSYQEFIKVKQCTSARDCLDLAKVIYKLLKDVNEEWKQANPPSPQQPPQQGQHQKGQKGEGEPQQGEGEEEPDEGQGEPGDEQGEPQSGGSKDFDDYENDKTDKSGKGSGEGDANEEGEEKDGTKGGARGKEKKAGGDKKDGDKAGKGDKKADGANGKGQGNEDADDDSSDDAKKGSGDGKDGEKDDGESDGKGNAGDDQGKKQDASQGDGNESGKDGESGDGSDGDGADKADSSGKGSQGDGADGDESDGDKIGGDTDGDAGGTAADGDGLESGDKSGVETEETGTEESEDEPNGKVKPGDAPYKPTDKEPKGGKDKRDLEDEFDGLSREQAQNEDLEEFFKNLPARDRQYTSRRDLDVHSVPETTEEDKTTYRDRLSQISVSVATMVRSLEQALRSLSKCRKNAYLRSGRIDRRRLVAIAKGLSREVFYQTKDGSSLDVAVEIIIDESGSMSNFYEVQLLAMAIGEALNRIRVPFEIIGTTTVYGGGDHRMVPMNGFSRVNPIAYKHYKLFAENWTTVQQRLIHTGCYNHNVDGEVVEYAAFRLAQRKERRKVIFSLSDGEPCAGHGNNAEMCVNLKRVCDRVRKQKIEVYSASIGTDSPAHLYGLKFSIVLPSIVGMGSDVVRFFTTVLTQGMVKV